MPNHAVHLNELRDIRACAHGASYQWQYALSVRLSARRRLDMPGVAATIIRDECRFAVTS